MSAAVGSAAGQGAFAVGGAVLRGVVSAVPGQPIDNARFIERFGEQAVNDVVKMIGVEARHWARPDQTTADLCLDAARVLLERLDWTADSVDALIFVSQTPDHRLPATACILHGRLGLAPGCQAFDVSLGCSGYTYGLWLAAAMINAGCRRVLLLAGETSSRLVDPSDRGTAILFGDAGTASGLEAASGAPPIHFRLGTDGSGAGALIVPEGGFRTPVSDPDRPEGLDPTRLHMDGGEVFTFTLRAVPRLIKDTLADAGVEGDSVDAYLLHQANRFMLRHIAKKIGASEAQTPINIDRYGNTSSATLPLLLTTDLARRVTSAPSRMMLVGFGVGLSWGSALMELEPLVCAETIVA
jgi:3-oxoacyl-[acyl-carrier-protein] synthase-3